MAEVLTPKRQEILDFIVSCLRERNFPPTIREIGEHVGLNSPATVANHLKVLKEAGYLAATPQQSRTITVRGTTPPAASASIHYLPFVGDVAAGTGVLAAETAHELMAIPEQFAGSGEHFVLQVRGESMINAGILPGDFVVVRRQPTANTGEIVVAGIPEDEATVKRFYPQGPRVVLTPENDTMAPLEFDASEVTIFGKVVSVLRNY